MGDSSSLVSPTRPPAPPWLENCFHTGDSLALYPKLRQSTPRQELTAGCPIGRQHAAPALSFPGKVGPCHPARPAAQQMFLSMVWQWCCGWLGLLFPAKSSFNPPGIVPAI